MIKNRRRSTRGGAEPEMTADDVIVHARGHVIVVECRSRILSQLSRHRTTVAPSTGDVGVPSFASATTAAATRLLAVQPSSTLRPPNGDDERARRPGRDAARPP